MAKPSRSSRRGPAVKGSKPAPPPADDIDITLPDGSVDLNGPPEDEYPADSVFDGAAGSGDAPLQVEADEGVDEAAQTVVSKGGSQRRSAARSSSRNSSRRGASTKSDRAASRRELTPEERIQRARARRAMVGLLTTVVVAGVAGFALWWLVLRTDPKVERFLGVLSQVKGELSGINANITNQQPDDADKALAQAGKDLEGTPCPDRQDLLNQKTAFQAQMKDLAARIELLKRDLLVQANKNALLAQFKHVEDPAMDLDKLEADVNAFIANPANPTGSPDREVAAAYASDCSDLQKRLSAISSARSHRVDQDTNAPVTDARDQAEGLIKQEKFQDALALVDDMARKFPNAKFDGVRDYVQDAAAQRWKSAKSFVEENYANYAALGTAPDVRKDALAAARARLHQVIDHFGIDTYVSQAKELLAKYPE